MWNRSVAAGWAIVGVCALAPAASAQEPSRHDPPAQIDLSNLPIPPAVGIPSDKNLQLLREAFRVDMKMAEPGDPSRLNNFSVPKWQATVSAGWELWPRLRVDAGATVTRGFERSPVLSQEIGGTPSQWIEHAFTGPGSYATTATGVLRMTVPLKNGRPRVDAIGEVWVPLWSTGHATMDGSFLATALKAGLRTSF